MKTLIKLSLGIFVICFLGFTSLGFYLGENYISSDYNRTVETYKDSLNSMENYIKSIKKENDDLKSKTLKQISLVGIAKDLEGFKSLSHKEKTLIYDSIVKFGKKYDINPIILYSVIYTESTLRPYIEHSEVYIKGIDKKVRAIGLGGIVYEIWGKELKENGIIETRQDLFFIENNIESVAYVLNKYFNMDTLPNAQSQLQSALMRYYGSQYSNYQNKILLKVASLIDFEFKN